MKALIALPLLLAGQAALAAPADDSAILHCRSLSEAGARLACYDAIPVARAGAPAPVTHAAPVPMSAPARASAPAPAPARAPALTAEQSFGMETVKKAEVRAEPEAPKFIESTIPGKFEGWGPNTQFKLANGQVWRVVDGSSADLAPVQDPQVKIVRNLFGTMFLEIAGTNNSPKVRRVR